MALIHQYLNFLIRKDHKKKSRVKSGVYTDTQQCHWCECVFSAPITHIWCVKHNNVATLLSAIAIGAKTCVPLLCAASTCSSSQPFFRPQLSLFFLNLLSTCPKTARREALLFWSSV